MASIGVWLSDGHPYNASRLLPPHIQNNNNVELEAASEAKKNTIRLRIRRQSSLSQNVSPKFNDKVTSLPKTKLHRFKQTQLYLLTKTAAIGSREASEFWCHNETIKKRNV